MQAESEKEEGDEERTDLSSSNLVRQCLLRSHPEGTDTERGEEDGCERMQEGVRVKLEGV